MMSYTPHRGWSWKPSPESLREARSEEVVAMRYSLPQVPVAELKPHPAVLGLLPPLTDEESEASRREQGAQVLEKSGSA
jgi:hypothetical protein